MKRGRALLRLALVGILVAASIAASLDFKASKREAARLASIQSEGQRLWRTSAGATAESERRWNPAVGRSQPAARQSLDDRLRLLLSLIAIDVKKMPTVDPRYLSRAYRYAEWSGWSAALMRTNPEYVRAALQDIRFNAQIEYAPLLNKLTSDGIDPAKFLDLAVASELWASNLGLSSDGQSVAPISTPRKTQDGDAEARAALGSQIAAALGAQAANDWAAYQSNAYGYAYSNSLQTRLSFSGEAMTADQFEALARAYSVEIEHTPSGVPPGVPNSAATILTPAQLAQLKAMQL